MQYNLKNFRKQKDAFFRERPDSPLKPDQRDRFTGLSYYPDNPDLVVQAPLTRFEKQEQVLIQTNRDELRPFNRYGRFTFSVDGTEVSLTLYKSPAGYYFLPFVDANAGTETYGAGRYVEPDLIDDDTVLVDFNLAYNPYCAYNDRFICPMTPPENRLDVPIEAGEMLPEGDWVEK